jgi:N,N'-diacetyllegionaminate synthase
MIKKVLIIAEAGVNHNGSIDLALDLVEAAADSGADVVKFQSFSADSIVTSEAKLAGYQEQNSYKLKTQHALLKQLELSIEDHRLILEHCKRNGIRFMSTGFDVPSLDLLKSLGQETFKVPSGEITNLPLLRRIGSLASEVIISTGLSTLEEIGSAILTLEKCGLARERIIVLHCTTQYPAPVVDLNLLAIRSLQEEFNVRVGYSDHSLGATAAVAAVALGSSVIEKHLTLDKKSNGPDHASSLNPKEFTEMVIQIRELEVALGDGVKRPMPSEEQNRVSVRKSIVASKRIEVGDVFSNENLTTKRPGSGLSPMRWDDFIGRSSERSYDIDEMIKEQ